MHIYGIDCGACALLPVEELPHCGAVVPTDQTDRVERLLSKLRTEIMRRQQLLAAQGLTGLMEQRTAGAGPKLPWMLLLLDWREGYAAVFEQYDFGRLIESLLQILREGSAVGLRAVVTTDRAALTGQVGSVFRERMILRLTDADDSALADIPTRGLPAHHPEGRVIFSEKPHPLEARIAMLDPDPSGLAQARALRQLAADLVAPARHRRLTGVPRRACHVRRPSALDGGEHGVRPIRPSPFGLSTALSLPRSKPARRPGRPENTAGISCARPSY